MRLEAALAVTGLSVGELWLRYLGLGGMGTPRELAAYLDGRDRGPFDDLEHDTLAHAFNERFTELGLDHPVPYLRG